MRRLLVLLVAVAFLSRAYGAAYATNHFLGSCLTEDWAAQVASARGVSRVARDPLGRLLHPYLHGALERTRFTFDDPRISSPLAYTSDVLVNGTAIQGVGAIVNASDGSVLDPGIVNGSVVLELNGWMTHSLVTLAFSLLVREVYGYPVSHLAVTDTLAITQRMASVLSGVTTPSHLNLEVWIAGIEASLQVYANESFSAGGLGYFGRSGLYTSVDFITSSLPLFANFWKSYEIHEELISAVPVSSLRGNAAFFPPNEATCADDSFGCLGNCSKTHACTLRENQQPPKECMVVVMMYDYYDPGYLQAVLANLNIPTYFCFIGYDGLEAFVVDAQKRQRPVLFYHFEPDLFHFHYKGLFERVFLPRSAPERIAMATGTFGENGYGGVTKNPVDVDFPTTKLSKYAASTVRGEVPLVRLLAQFTLSELDVNDLMDKYLAESNKPEEPDPVFRAACSWVQENYDVWSLWLERLPLCTFASHIHYDVTGCTSLDDEAVDDNGVRIISFSWRMPHPDNASSPYNCDGGMVELPRPIYTSRSCEWVRSDPARWTSWINGKPECDSRFYKYSISQCSAAAVRTIQYSWLLPNPLDPTSSLECDGGVQLPEDLEEDCDYLPYASPLFVSIAVADGALAVVLIVTMGFIYVHRSAPIIKRSQYELLLLILVGGLLVCVAILLYAGPPTLFLCGARPLVMSAGFTSIFGALLVKALRVYRVFMGASFKKSTVSVSSMFRVFFAIFAVDLLIIAAWYVMDFPEPTTTLRRSVKFDGYVTDLVCASSSFLFTAMMFFWKAIVLFVGLYVSFLIRNVSTDFQESFWTFSACLVVLVGSVVILPIAYIVDLAPSTFVLFHACILLVCTTLVMAVMFVPKALRFRTAAVVAGGASSRSSKSSAQIHMNGATSVRSFGQANMSMTEADGRASDMPGATAVGPLTPTGPSTRSTRGLRSSRSRH